MAALILRFLTLLMLVASLSNGVARAEMLRPSRTQVSLPPQPSAMLPLDRFVVAQALGDTQLVQAALDDDGWPQHLRSWATARLALTSGDLEAAAHAFDASRAAWPGVRGEPEAVLAAFDAAHLRVHLDRGDREAAHAVRSAPLRLHEDAVWKALGARLALLDGDLRGAVARFETAWNEADSRERQDPAFFHRALAHLAEGDSLRAAQSWVETLDVMRRPEHLRAALLLADEEPALWRVCDRDGLREPALRWLVRVFRRPQAFEWASVSWREAEPAEGRRLFVFAAEQLYRLRRHDELAGWLEGPRPEGLEPEQLAELEAYPWGVARRAGSSVEIAEGFEAVAERYSGTARATEAIWEAAWMYELAGETQRAAAAFGRYVDLAKSGTMRESAALRALWLPLRDGSAIDASERFERLRDALGDGMQEAGALRLVADVLRERGEVDRASTLETELQTRHENSPLWRGIPRHDWENEAPGWEQAKRLHAEQLKAFETVAGFIGLESLETLWTDEDSELYAAGRLAELGLGVDAEARLDALARRDDRDDRMRLAVVATAWRWGLAETQARNAWWLSRRLQPEDEVSRRALDVLSLPTPYAGTAFTLADELGISPVLFWSVARRESFFDADVVSIAGAYGLMQLLPSTAVTVAERWSLTAPRVAELFVPEVNMGLGARYLSDLLGESEGDLVQALSAYNAGERNGRRWRERRLTHESAGMGIYLISYSETRAYAYNVLRNMNLYLSSYPSLRVD